MPAELCPTIEERMVVHGETGAGVVGYKTIFSGHLEERRGGGCVRGGVQQWPSGTADLLYLPESIATMRDALDPVESTDTGELSKLLTVKQRDSEGKIFGGGEGAVPLALMCDGVSSLHAKTFDVAHAEAHGE